MTDKILLLNGPNLNLLGQRESNIYGTKNLEEIYSELLVLSQSQDIELKFQQSNSEADLINSIQNARQDTNFILLNAGAYTHTSIAIRDALLTVKIPFFEIHISNIYARESFRHKSYLADIAVGVITGFGTDGYKYALMAAISKLKL